MLLARNTFLLSKTCTVVYQHMHLCQLIIHLQRQTSFGSKIISHAFSKDKVWHSFYCLCSVGTRPTSWQSCRNLWSSHWSLSLWSHCWACSRFWFPLWGIHKYRNSCIICAKRIINYYQLIVTVFFKRSLCLKQKVDCAITDSIHKCASKSNFTLLTETAFRSVTVDSQRVSLLCLYGKHILNSTLSIGAGARSITQWNGGQIQMSGGEVVLEEQQHCFYNENATHLYYKC